MVNFHSAAIAVALLFTPIALAHPGDDHHEEAMKRAKWLDQVERRDLSHCAEKLKARGVHARSLARRRDLAKNLRLKRGLATTAPMLKARDLASVSNTSHLSPLTGLTADSSSDLLFTGNSTCILNPEVTEGPYYVQGELLRKDVTENQEGVALTLDIQIIDVATCEPVPNLYFDLWHCNSTGVYSGINANGNGNSADTTNIDNTFLRGIQQTGSDGVVVFDTLFPGHYMGRATHIHVMGHDGATVASNKTLSSQGRVDHVGQIFFDQDLISQVEATMPYNTNTQAVTLNVDDMIASQASENVDPFAEYVLLGSAVSDGILAWTTIGVNVSASHNVTAAATIYQDGGVANPNAMGGGPDGAGSGPPGSNSTAGVASVSTSTAASATSGSSTITTGSSVATISSSGADLSAKWYSGVLAGAMGAGALFF